MTLWEIWLIVALVFVIVEIFTAGIAVICFSFGGLGAALVSGLGGNVVWQVVVFALVTILSFIFLRPLLLRLFAKKGKDEVKTNVDALIGRVGVVSERIDGAANTGRVAIDGDDWKAVASQEGAVIEAGTKVEIMHINSIILTVKKI